MKHSGTGLSGFDAVLCEVYIRLYNTNCTHIPELLFMFNLNRKSRPLLIVMELPRQTGSVPELKFAARTNYARLN